MNRKEFEREAYIYTQEKMVHYSADQNEVIEMLAEFAEKVQEKNAEDIKANCDYILEGKENEYREERKKLCDDFENMKAGLESQIATLGKRCNQLLKDKGELTDKIADIKVNCDFAIEGRDIKIKELELKLEQTEKDLADYQFNYPKIKELQKENADLKEEINKIAFARGTLEEENAELKKVAEFQQSINMNRHFENKKLKEGLAVGSMWNKHLNSQNKALEEERDRYRNMTFDQREQLTKAKELLKKLLSAYTSYADSFDDRDNEIVSEAEQFLSEVGE